MQSALQALLFLQAKTRGCRFYLALIFADCHELIMFGEAKLDYCRGPEQGFEPAGRGFPVADVKERILVLSPSAARAWALCRVLEEAGFDVWAGRNVQDGLVLAASLQFSAIVADENCANEHPELWQQMHEVSPQACVLVRSRKAEDGGKPLERPLGGSDEVLLGVLTLLLSQTQATVRAQAA